MPYEKELNKDEGDKSSLLKKHLGFPNKFQQTYLNLCERTSSDVYKLSQSFLRYPKALLVPDASLPYA